MQGPRNGFTIWFALLNPHSRGSVRLGPRDPGAAPLIDPGFLTDQRDLAGMLAGLRLARVGSYYHPVGTCRMGTDTAAVADPQLRVHGIDGLRVADASVMPSLPAANTNATVLAIAERAVDLITAQDL